MWEYQVTCVRVRKDPFFENGTCFPSACSSQGSHLTFAFALGRTRTGGAERPRRWSREEGKLPDLQSVGAKIRLTITFSLLPSNVFCLTSVRSST